MSLRLPAGLALSAALCAATSSASTQDAARTRRQFLAIVRPQRVELNPVVTPLCEPDGMRREKVVFHSEPGRRVAMLVVRPPDSFRRPAVLVLHGTRGRKEAMEPWLRVLAQAGFVACATDARYHGELAAADYEAALIAAYRSGKGHPWLYETVTDTIRALDYLQSRADVDGERIGLSGVSMGGMVTWLTAAVDTRVRAAVPVIGVTSFGHQIRSGHFESRCRALPYFHLAVARDLGEPRVTERVARHAWDRVLPGITNRFDCPRMLAAIAPRPLLILSAEYDDRCPLPAVRACHEAALSAYRARRAEDRLRLVVAPGTGHKVSEEMRRTAVDWLAHWLGPVPAPPPALREERSAFRGAGPRLLSAWFSGRRGGL